MLKKLFVLLLAGLPVITSAQESCDLSVKKFREKIQTSPGAVILDVRTPDELKNGMVEGAVQIDYFDKELEQKLQALDKGKEYLVYCESGVRSSEVKALMQRFGIKNICTLAPGLKGWRKAGMPLVKPH